MVELTGSDRPERPHPPGDYPAVVVGSGPGGLQTGYCLSRLGIDHALLSADDAPAGMFRHFPFFQRLITWTKPFAPAERGTRSYEWFDWNSPLAVEPENRALVAAELDGSSYFPSRPEMERGWAAFTERAGLAVRYGCRWESTSKSEQGFVVGTSDGEYRCRALVVAVGMTEAWKPNIPGLDQVPHYVDLQPAKAYEGKRVFIIGKRNSGFEVADGLLPWAKQIVLASPRPARISILVHSTAAARARYMQPYEDHVLGGGNLVLDAAIERVERHADGWTIRAKGTTVPGDLTFQADEVVAATGFGTPLQDLSQLGVATFFQGRLPAQTAFWESASLPRVFFAGSITQGSIGLKKYGIPSNSAAVHGFRYNARTLAEHLARTHFGWQPERQAIEPKDLVAYLLDEATHAPELWNQRSYLCRVVSLDPDDVPRDEGILPLQHFVDAAEPDALAITVETDQAGDIHPAVYVRHGGSVDEHLLAGNPTHDFSTKEHRRHLHALLKPNVTAL